jgi:hypothetical protein
MDTGRFDALTHSFSPTPSRRRAFRVLGIVGAVGLVDHLDLPAAAARKKGGKKKCRQRPCPEFTCPEPTVCPPPLSTCPSRTCCRCTAASPAGAGCHFGPAATNDIDGSAVCEQVCGSGNVSSFYLSFAADGYTTGCDANSQCTALRCPLY